MSVSARVAAQDDPCAAIASRARVVACAVRASPIVYGEQRGLAAVAGRRTAASLVLPSNPTLAATAGARNGGGEGTGLDWTATLSQEVEIGGQRSARLDVVAAQDDGQRARLMAAQRDAGAAALNAYFDALAAIEEKRVTDKLLALGDAVARLAQGRFDAGLASQVEVEIALAAATRFSVASLTADRHVRATAATLTTLLGYDPTRGALVIEGDFEPLADPTANLDALVRGAIALRAEIAVAEAERRQEARRAELLRRSRTPNLTFSVFAQADRFTEHVFGGGLSLPIPLPAPVGHTFAGEIAEAEALAQRAAAETERLRRTVRLEALNAYDAVAARRKEVALFSAERLKRADDAIQSITRELEAKRLGVRDAILAQQGLVELFSAYVEARRQLCLASVELARVAGLPLDRGGAQ